MKAVNSSRIQSSSKHILCPAASRLLFSQAFQTLRPAHDDDAGGLDMPLPFKSAYYEFVMETE
jgi:hypothetical protein